MADFNFKSQIDPTAIAGLAQRQAETQAKMQQDAAAQKMKMIQDVAQSVGSMVSSSIEASKERQRKQLDKNLGDSLAAKYVPNTMAPQEGPGLPAQAGPIYGNEQSLPPVSTPDVAGRKAFSQQVQADPKPWRALAVDMMNPLKQAEADKLNSQALRDRQLTGPTTPATQDLVNRMASTLKMQAPDMSRMTEQQSNQWLDNAKGQMPQASASSPGELTDEDRKRLAPLAKMIGEFRAKDPNTLVSGRGADKEKLSLVLAEMYPNVNLQNYAQQVKMRNDFAMSGVSGKALVAASTAINHMDTLQGKIDALDNKEITRYNSIGNWAAKNVGKPEVAGFNAVKTLVDGELAKIVQGGVGVVTNEEREQFRKNLDASSSPAQAKEVLSSYIDLIKGRIDTVKDGWTSTMGDTKPPMPFLTAKAKKILIKNGYNADTMEKTDASIASGGKFVALDGGYSYRVK